jgi:ArsR family transcriptional regulator, arsenate/arsenite/antimonite-responsive transcriptional repressor
MGAEGTAACCSSGVGLPTGTSEAAAAQLAAALKALADPVRLRLLSMLAAAPEGEVCACDLVSPLGRSQPTISHHLKALRESGLVRAERRGTWIWYSVDRGRMESTLAALSAAVGLQAALA